MRRLRFAILQQVAAAPIKRRGLLNECYFENDKAEPNRMGTDTPLAKLYIEWIDYFREIVSGILLVDKHKRIGTVTKSVLCTIQVVVISHSS